MTVTDANGNTTTNTYDALNRLVTVTDAMGYQVSYAYNAVGNRTSLTNANGGVTMFQYDSRNRLTSVVDPLGNTTSYTYNPDAALATKKTASMQGMPDEIGYQYDVFGRRTGITYPDASTISFTYDENGNRTSATDSNSNWSWQYDALGRVMQFTDNNLLKTIQYSYDAVGNRIQMTDPEGNVIDYTYNAANRIDLIKKNTVTEADYDYDAGGRLIKRTLGNGSYTEYSYDNASQLTLLANKRSNGQVLSSFAYQRDNAAYITQIEMTQENADQTTTHNFVHYTYDQLYRLTGEVRKDETDTNTIYTQTFTYDANGNRLQQVKTGTIGDETINYTYNAADQMVQEAVVGGATTSYSFDANGNMIQKSDGVNTCTYGYDYENRLISFDAPGTANDAIYVYAIDSWERLSKTLNGVTTKYLRDGPNVIAEYDGANTLIATYLEGLAMDEHISKTIGANPYRYLTDHLVSVRQLIDSSEAIQDSYDYSSFGEVLGTPTENVSNEYRFTGRRWDSENSSQYHRWRTYFPELGRWNRIDPFGDIDGPNLYLYTRNHPVAFVDLIGGPIGIGPIWIPKPIPIPTLPVPVPPIYIDPRPRPRPPGYVRPKPKPEWPNYRFRHDLKKDPVMTCRLHRSIGPRHKPGRTGADWTCIYKCYYWEDGKRKRRRRRFQMDRPCPEKGLIDDGKFKPIPDYGPGWA